MAIIENRVCDLDASHKGDATTHVLGHNGGFVQLDLCKVDDDKLAEVLDPYFSVGVAISAKDAMKLSGGGGSFDPTVVRAWAQRKGRPVNDRGRIPADLVQAWREDSGQ